MILNQITQAQKKIIIVTVIVLVVFIIFWSFVYAPGKREVSQLKLELAATQQELEDIQMIASQGDTLEESIALLKERFLALEGKFPAKEEEALRKISGFARQLNINLISLNPGVKEVVVHGEEGAIEIDQRVCQSILVAIDMNCSYEDLVRYIDLLKQDLPALVTVEKLEISRVGTVKSEKLNIRLNFKLYFLS